MPRRKYPLGAHPDHFVTTRTFTVQTLEPKAGAEAHCSCGWQSFVHGNTVEEVRDALRRHVRAHAADARMVKTSQSPFLHACKTCGVDALQVCLDLERDRWPYPVGIYHRARILSAAVGLMPC